MVATPSTEDIGNAASADLNVSPTSSTGMSWVSATEREPLPESLESLHIGPLNKTQKDTITILLIGETGSGKTTLMSLIANLLHGNGPFELADYHDERKESGLDKTQSQTTKATLYSIAAPDGRRIQILDTPGLADTRGIGQDKIHKEEINNAIQEYVSSIDAVVIVANGTVERLTVATDYTLNIICSMFPRTIINNIGFIFTNSTQFMLNFDPESLRPELKDAPCWAIQNPLAALKGYNNQKGRQRYSANQLQRQIDQLNDCYEEAVETLNEWLNWVDDRDLQTTVEIDRLYRISTDIESNIESTLATITRLSEQRAHYKKIQSDLQDAKKAKRALQDLKQRNTARVWDRQPTDQPNTICIAPNCYSNCHAPCNMSMTDDHASLGRWCAVFKNYRPLPVWDGASAVCKVCNHPSSQHRHYRQLHFQKAREIEPEQEKTQEISNAATEERKLETAKAAAERKIKEIEENMISAQDTISILVENYNETSLSRNFAGHVRSAIQMLNLRKEELKTKPNTDAALQLIDQSIYKFQQQLEILAKEETRWATAKMMFQTVRNNMVSSPSTPRKRPLAIINESTNTFN